MNRIILAAAVALAVTIGGCTSTEPAPTPLSTVTSTGTVPTAPVETPPPSMRQRTIDSLKVGDSGYTTPWAMWVDMDSRMWLHPRYPIGPEGGTSTMRVERLSDGFHVWPPSDAKYTPAEDPGFVGSQDLAWIRVVAIEGW